MTRKTETRTMTMTEAVDEAMSELTALGEEMREWADNTEERFGSTEKWGQVDEAATTLEGIQGVDMPDSLVNLQVRITLPNLTPKQALRQSRAARRDTAITILSQCIEALEAGENADDREALSSELDNAKQEAEGVEFPGIR